LSIINDALIINRRAGAKREEREMRKVIDQRVYNTETAEGIAEWGNGLNVGDFYRAEETLYRTPKGNWFLYGEGGAHSRWSSPEGDGRGPGKDIVPFTAEEAAAWLERRGNVEALEEYFSDVLEEA
jgi:hypothetical protein